MTTIALLKRTIFKHTNGKQRVSQKMVKLYIMITFVALPTELQTF